MEPSNSGNDLVEWIYSWIPRRVEAQAQIPLKSRDFWMADKSCRFCFECESQFGLFNRRHHCRRCGKVFCGKCSLNTIPASVEEGVPDEEGERVRVCNYCFDLHSIPPTPTLTISLSAQSVNSSPIGASASIVPLSPQLTVSGGPPGDRPTYTWDEALDESTEQMYTMRPHQGGSRVLGSMSPRAGDQPPSPYRFDNRSDDDEDEFERQREDDTEEEEVLRGRPLQDQPDDYGDESGAEFSQDPTDREGKTGSRIYSTQSSISQNPSLSDDDSTRRGETSDGKGSSEGMEENVDENPFPFDDSDIKEKSTSNFEKNPLIWIPPPPANDLEDEEDDDVGTSPVDYDDDDEEGGAGWAVPKSPGSVGNEDIKKDKAASDEPKKAMRKQLDIYVEQLLEQKGIEKDRWLDIVSSLSMEAASFIKPDTSNGGGMDPGAYVKVKCVAAGRPSDSLFVKGIVCRKNVAHKRMTSRYKNPRLLLLGGALEYQRVSNQLSSLDTLINQEHEHLKMTVARIEAHHPNVLLVEKSVSRYAQDILLNKEISLVLNVKRPLLDRIAKCVGGQVVPSPDNLVTPKAVHCESFHVEKFVEEHGPAGGGKQLQKFLMFFEGCPKPLGCTILLKGENGDFLKTVKKVVQLAVFRAYHLQLETSFLEDEGATLPPPCRSTLNLSLNRHSGSERPAFAVSSSAILEPAQPQQISSGQSSSVSISPLLSRANSIGTSAAVSNLDTASTATNAVPFSASSSCGSSATNSPEPSPAQSSFAYPSGVSRSESIGGTSTTTYHQTTSGVYPGGQSWQGVSGLSVSLKRTAQDGNLDGDENAEASTGSGGEASLAFEVKALEVNTVSGPSYTSNFDQIVTTTASMVSKGTIRENGDDYQIVPEQVQAQLRVVIQNNGLSEMERSKEGFPPSSDGQSILVQFSKRCLAKATIVKAPHFVRIKFYGNGDKPLGMFLRDTLFDTTRPCENCDESGEKHVLSYIHRQGSLTITVHKDPNNSLSGEKTGKIWMWHRCLKCPLENGVPPATPRVIMSDAAWSLSFGKFLELCFSTDSAASRVAACGHSLHRHCLRFYGFGSMVACFRYAVITIRTFYLPPLKLEFNSPKQQDFHWLTDERNEVSKQAEEVFSEVLNRLQVLAEKIQSARALCGNGATLDAQRRIVALETLLQNEKAALEEALSRSDRDILKFNRLRRDLLISSLQWDWRLEYLIKKCLPTRKRGTGSVDDPSILSAKELDIGNGSVKSPESAETERESSSADTSFDAESTSWSLAGLSPSEQANLENKQTDTQSTSLEQPSISGNVINLHDPLCPTATELADENGLDFRLSMDGESPGVEDLLDNINLTPQKGNLSGSKSEMVESTSGFKKFGEVGSTEALGDEDSTAVEEGDSETSKVSPPRFLEGDVTARRALSEGNYPLLADLSDTLDAAWTGEPGPGDSPPVDESEEKAVDIVRVNEEGHDPESQGPVHEEASTDQPRSEAVAEDDATSHDKGIIIEGQVSVPDSPVTPGCSEDLSELTEGSMDTPFANFFKSFSRTSSILSTSSDAKVPPPGLPSIIPRAAQINAEGNARRIFLPQGHDDVVVAVYDEEPTSMIAYALSTEEHYVHVTDILVEKEKVKEKSQDKEFVTNYLSPEQTLSHPLQSADVNGEVDIAVRENFGNSNAVLNSKIESEIENPLISTKASQMVKKTISFSEETPSGKVKFQVTCYFAKQFDALRKKCCMGTQYIRSLSRCKKWGAQGGKSNVFFAKTADDRFVVKQVTKTELTSFLDFASSYFKYLFDALTTGNPTCLAKILGVYEVKTTKGGKETKMDVLVMENLLYGRHISQIYDLKGSVRSRYNADAASDTGKSKVKLDQNLVEEMPTNPLYVGNNAKRLLERAIWNDTHFLSLVFVMDYSLLVGVDEERQELVVGIIDFIRQYTWDKHLETWVKASGFLGGPKNAPPTVISPKQYKKRFRKAMSSYFLMVPDQWIPPPQPLASPLVVNTVEENSIEVVIKRDDGRDDPDTPGHIPVIKGLPHFVN